MDRRFATVALVVLVMTAGCLGGDRPLVPGGLTGTPSPAAPSDTGANVTVPATTTGGTTAAGTRAPADPPSDRLGWEAGRWYNETLPIDARNGLNETELEALVARTMARVERIRKVEFKKPVPVETISRAEFRDRYGSSGDPDSRIRTYRNTLYEALLLVGEGTDAVSERQRNLASGVLGFYSAGNDQITIVTDNETVRIRETILAHELVHALQDQVLESGNARARSTDQFYAFQAVNEGDPSLVQARYAQRCDAGWSCVTKERGGNLTGLHLGLYFLTLFPYTDGESFVEAIYDRSGWAGVNRLYETPPSSAEQVIYPERYPDDTTATVRIPDRSNRFWRPLYSDADTLGQPSVAAMFAYTVVDDREGAVIEGNPFRLNQSGGYDYNFSYADGWNGDAFRVYRNGSGGIGYVWRLAWSSPAEAREFAAGYRELLRYWGAERVPDREGVWRIPEGTSEFADAFYITVNGDTVTIVNAPSVNQLRGVHRSVG